MKMIFRARRGRPAVRASISCPVVAAVLCVLLGWSTVATANVLPTVATGTITCARLSGTIMFSPPVRLNLRQKDTITITVRAGACKTHNSNVKFVAGGTLTLKVTTMVDGIPFEMGLPLTGTETWETPSAIAPSEVVSSGYSERANGGAQGLVYTSSKPQVRVIVLPGGGGSFSATGSFAGKASYPNQEDLHGAVVAYTNSMTGHTGCRLTKTCKSVTVSGVSIVQGIETLP